MLKYITEVKVNHQNIKVPKVEETPIYQHIYFL